MGSLYCYNANCPARTKEEPWPRSDYEIKSTKIISKNGKAYYRKLPVCKHCGERMTFVATGIYED